MPHPPKGASRRDGRRQNTRGSADVDDGDESAQSAATADCGRNSTCGSAECLKGSCRNDGAIRNQMSRIRLRKRVCRLDARRYTSAEVAAFRLCPIQALTTRHR